MAKKPTKKVALGSSKSGQDQRRDAFVEAYIANGGNATDAAIRAGYSPTSARFQGSKLLKDRNAAQQIAQRQQQLAKKYQITTEDIIKSIKQELHFDPAKLYNEDGSLKSIVDLDEDTRMALASVEMVQLGSPDSPVFVRKVKWATRQGAREQAMKHLGMFERDNEQSRSITKVVLVPPKRSRDD